MEDLDELDPDLLPPPPPTPPSDEELDRWVDMDNVPPPDSPPPLTLQDEELLATIPSPPPSDEIDDTSTHSTKAWVPPLPDSEPPDARALKRRFTPPPERFVSPPLSDADTDGEGEDAKEEPESALSSQHSPPPPPFDETDRLVAKVAKSTTRPAAVFTGTTDKEDQPRSTIKTIGSFRTPKAPPVLFKLPPPPPPLGEHEDHGDGSKSDSKDGERTAFHPKPPSRPSFRSKWRTMLSMSKRSKSSLSGQSDENLKSLETERTMFLLDAPDETGSLNPHPPPGLSTRVSPPPGLGSSLESNQDRPLHPSSLSIPQRGQHPFEEAQRSPEWSPGILRSTNDDTTPDQDTSDGEHSPVEPRLGLQEEFEEESNQPSPSSDQEKDRPSITSEHDVALLESEHAKVVESHEDSELNPDSTVTESTVATQAAKIPEELESLSQYEPGEAGGTLEPPPPPPPELESDDERGVTILPLPPLDDVAGDDLPKASDRMDHRGELQESKAILPLPSPPEEDASESIAGTLNEETMLLAPPPPPPTILADTNTESDNIEGERSMLPPPPLDKADSKKREGELGTPSQDSEAGVVTLPPLPSEVEESEPKRNQLMEEKNSGVHSPPPSPPLELLPEELEDADKMDESKEVDDADMVNTEESNEVGPSASERNKGESNATTPQKEETDNCVTLLPPSEPEASPHAAKRDEAENGVILLPPPPLTPEVSADTENSNKGDVKEDNGVILLPPPPLTSEESADTENSNKGDVKEDNGVILLPPPPLTPEVSADTENSNKGDVKEDNGVILLPPPPPSELEASAQVAKRDEAENGVILLPPTPSTPEESVLEMKKNDKGGVQEDNGVILLPPPPLAPEESAQTEKNNKSDIQEDNGVILLPPPPPPSEPDELANKTKRDEAENGFILLPPPPLAPEESAETEKNNKSDIQEDNGVILLPPPPLAPSLVANDIPIPPPYPPDEEVDEFLAPPPAQSPPGGKHRPSQEEFTLPPPPSYPPPVSQDSENKSITGNTAMLTSRIRSGTEQSDVLSYCGPPPPTPPFSHDACDEDFTEEPSPPRDPPPLPTLRYKTRGPPSMQIPDPDDVFFSIPPPPPSHSPPKKYEEETRMVDRVVSPPATISTLWNDKRLFESTTNMLTEMRPPRHPPPNNTEAASLPGTTSPASSDSSWLQFARPPSSPPPIRSKLEGRREGGPRWYVGRDVQDVDIDSVVEEILARRRNRMGSSTHFSKRSEMNHYYSESKSPQDDDDRSDSSRQRETEIGAMPQEHRVVRLAASKWSHFRMRGSPRARVEEMLHEDRNFEQLQEDLEPSAKPRGRLPVYGDCSTLCQARGLETVVASILGPVSKIHHGWARIVTLGKKWERSFFWLNRSRQKFCWRDTKRGQKAQSVLGTNCATLSRVKDIRAFEQEMHQLKLYIIELECVDVNLAFSKINPNDLQDNDGVVVLQIGFVEENHFEAWLQGLTFVWNFPESLSGKTIKLF